MRRWIAGGIVFAVLWMGWALLLGLAAQLGGPLTKLLAAFPRVPGICYGWPVDPALIVAILTGVLVVLSYAVLGRALGPAGRPGFARAWLAAILAAAVVGLALDLPSMIRGVGMFGIRGLLIEPYSMQKAVFWAVLVGWMPGLIVARRRTAPPAAEASLAPARSARRRPGAWVLAGATGVVFVVLALAGVWGIEAANAQIKQAALEQEAAQRDAFGALPDPDAAGEPVPVRIDRTETTPTDACTNENSTVLLGSGDAALGRGMQVIELLNFSEQPCAVEGYPDIAFGDQNGHVLAATLTHGGSSIGEDPGPVRVTVPAGGTVRTVLAWHANSTHGALVAHSLHAAVRAGEDRGSWPVELDIPGGTDVSVSAWHALAAANE